MTRHGPRRSFDAFLIVDWSSASWPRRGKDSIWWVTHELDTRGGSGPRNPKTRSKATTEVKNELRRLKCEGKRVLVGFDFPYGYPAGLAKALGLPGAPWLAIWEHLAEAIRDDDQNANNRFEVAGKLNVRITKGKGPFWGCGRKRVPNGLSSCRRGIFEYPLKGLKEKRQTEDRASGTQSAWKLSGAGSVGGQAIVGIPRLHELRFDPELRAVSKVWPFETGFKLPTREEAAIVHAEIWPSLVSFDHESHPIKDARQVLALAKHFAALDAKGELPDLFAMPEKPLNKKRALREEGWILGVR